MTANPLFAHLAWMTANPFIPELHLDDCDDVTCVRCEPPNPIERLDVPAAVVEQQVAADVLRRARAATHSPSDALAYSLDLFLLAHPEACSTDADYPEWAAGLALQTAKNHIARRAS
jgi:hypothetical protein